MSGIFNGIIPDLHSSISNLHRSTRDCQQEHLCSVKFNVSPISNIKMRRYRERPVYPLLRCAWGPLPFGRPSRRQAFPIATCFVAPNSTLPRPTSDLPPCLTVSAFHAHRHRTPSLPLTGGTVLRTHLTNESSAYCPRQVMIRLRMRPPPHRRHHAQARVIIRHPARRDRSGNFIT